VTASSGTSLDHVAADSWPDSGAAAGPASRHLALEAVHNFRDIGGYPVVGPVPGTVRTGVLYRADGLNRLTEADIDTVSALGLRTVIDLRTLDEVDERGRFPLERHPAAWHHLSIIDVTWTGDTLHEHLDASDFLMTRYLEMGESGARAIVGLFDVLASPGALPAVFHCAAGKDRTGVVAALVLGALGVPDRSIVADYALTGEAMERMRSYALATNPEMAARMATMPPAFLAAEPAAMEGFLALVRARHGSIVGYLHSVGVSDHTIDAVRAALVQPAS
jgi:protein-tyrosine phosphatase